MYLESMGFLAHGFVILALTLNLSYAIFCFMETDFMKQLLIFAVNLRAKLF